MSEDRADAAEADEDGGGGKIIIKIKDNNCDMYEIYSVESRKGGVGKTTIALGDGGTGSSSLLNTLDQTAA